MASKLNAIRVLAPNLKRRLSGVTATIVRLVPVQAKDIDIRATGPGLPKNVPHIPLWQLPFLSRGPMRVWHARRNTEMLLGLVLRDVFRLKLKLLFTSASQRQHSGYTSWLISKMDRIIATSEKTAGYMERDSTVVMHGIDVSGFSVSDEKAALRAKLSLPQTGPLLGCYGRIRAQKGTDLFVDAMIDLFGAGQAGYAIVMGRAISKHQAFLEGLKAKVAQAGLQDRILFMPEVDTDQMADWYRVLDVYIAPQRWEGFGLTPIEAMACGVPVVATKVGAFEEIVVPHGGVPTGALIEIGDQAGMVAATSALLSDEPQLHAASRAARAHVEARFTLQREADALVAIYKELLGDD